MRRERKREKGESECEIRFERLELKGKKFYNASFKPNKMFSNYIFFSVFVRFANGKSGEREFDCIRAIQLYFMSVFRVYCVFFASTESGIVQCVR